MLKLDNIKKVYGSLEVLDIPSWEVARGESVALLGANATGKTTLLEIIAGLIQPTSGTVFYEGKPVHQPVGDIGLVLQNPVMFSSTVAGNVGFGIRGNGLSKLQRVERINETLHMVGLDGLQGRNARKLSAGQKQRVAIARTLAMKPKLLLLDEPSASVDRESVAHIAEILTKLNDKEGMTLIVSTHDLSFAKRIAKRTDQLQSGYPVPYISGNLFTGRAREENGETIVMIGDGAAIVVGGKYQGDVDIAIPPENIVVSMEPLSSSMRNNLHGKVIRLSDEGNSIEVVIDIGVPLVAVLTKGSLDKLGVTIGDEVYASFKAHGIMVFPGRGGMTK